MTAKSFKYRAPIDAARIDEFLRGTQYANRQANHKAMVSSLRAVLFGVGIEAAIRHGRNR